MLRRPRAAGLVLLSLAVLVGCGGGGKDPSSAVGGSNPSTRVAVLVLENHEAHVLDDPGAPYLSSLARNYALATNAFGLMHPSLPNYIALVTGRTAGITSDCVPSDCPVSGPSLVDQLEAHRISWRGYMESMPKPCFHYTGDELGRYAQRHNPFAYLTARLRAARALPEGRAVLGAAPRHAPRDVALQLDHAEPLPRHARLRRRRGRQWLRRTVPPLLRALGPNGVLILTFDEGTTEESCCNGAHGGQIATILAGDGARRSATYDQPVDHYSTLATVEALLGLPKLGDAPIGLQPDHPVDARRYVWATTRTTVGVAPCATAPAAL